MSNRFINEPLNLDEFTAFLETQSDATKIYIGGDSEKLKFHGEWVADYATVIVVHIDGCKGAKIFGEVIREPVFDQKKDRPVMRLMTEVYKISEMYLRVQNIIERFELLGNVQIHLDLNGKKVHNSNLVVDQAIGYIKGTTGLKPEIKPDAWSASYAADRFKEVIHMRKHPPTASNIRRYNGANRKKRRAA